MAALKDWAAGPRASRPSSPPRELIRIQFDELVADLADADRAAADCSPAHAVDPVEQLTSLMTTMGVPDDLAGELTRATVAVATIARHGVLPIGVTPAVLSPGRLTEASRPVHEDERSAAQGEPAAAREDVDTQTGENPVGVDGHAVGQDASDWSPRATKARSALLVDAIGVVSRVGGRFDGMIAEGTAELSAGFGQLLLADKGVASIDELTSGQRDKWRARAKSLTRLELELVTGWGVRIAADMVSLASSPSPIWVPVREALARGEVTWFLVRRFLRACAAAHLSHEEAAGVSNALFGSDPAVACTERLTSSREFTGQQWRQREYFDALDREVAKASANHGDDAAEKHEKVSAASELTVTADEDGTACVMLRCSTTQAAAIADRIESGARRARTAGDPRALPQLSAAITAMLLLHGGVSLPDLPDDPDLISPELTDQLAKILHGLPAATLEVIVPLNLMQPCPDGTARDARGPGTGVECADGPGSPPESGEKCAGDHGSKVECVYTGHCPGCARSPGAPADAATAGAEAEPPAGVATGRFGDSFFGVGRVKGRFATFLTPHEVAGLALTPGSTMFRLVTDPLSGRCLERSTTAYRFDAAMRAQIRAADVSCRAPGCLVPGRYSQIDHVQEFGTPGGETREANGALAHSGHHDQKTKRALEATINANRDITWRTLLGKIYRTKAHDYTQYSSLLGAAVDRVEGASNDAERSGLIDAAIYQALSYRPDGESVIAPDDEVGSDEDEFAGWDLVVLTHTDQVTGKRVYRPDPKMRDAEMTAHQDTRPSGQTGRMGPVPRDSKAPTDVPRSGSPRPGLGNAVEDEFDRGTRRTFEGRGPWGVDDGSPPPF